MTLKDYIDAEPDNASKTDAQVLAWLESDSDAFHEFSVTSIGLVKYVGADVARRLINTLVLAAQGDPLINETLLMMRSGVGVNLGDPTTQGMLAAFGADTGLELTAADADLIKALPARKSMAEKGGFTGISLGVVERERGSV